jgi:acyl homoserine lactone synthase
MLQLLSFTTISKQGDLFISQFQLRQREFIERQNYDVHSVDGMEFDKYDTLASKYLVYTLDGKTVLGASRLTPIGFGCMLQDHFDEFVDDKTIFSTPDVWEGTRFCIDSRLPPEQRRLICQTLVCGYLEFGIHRGVDRIIGLMPTMILRTVFERNGIALERLGAARSFGDSVKLQAASIAVSQTQLDRTRLRTGLEAILFDDRPIRQEHAA